MLRRPRRSEPSKAIRAASLCEMPSLRRGRRPHHVRKGTRRNLRDLMSGHRLQSRAGPHREGEEPKPMMHGHEKSDSAIVAMNKAGRPAAEAVERRAEAKENANRCCTCRTQGRASVSLALERVRKAEASRQSSEVGAVCRKAARTVLCGGRPVMGVPTAIARRLRLFRRDQSPGLPPTATILLGSTRTIAFCPPSVTQAAPSG